MQSFKFVYKGRSFSVLPYKFPFTLEIDGEVLEFVDDSGSYQIIEEEK